MSISTNKRQSEPCDFVAAGCLFTDGTHLIAGYQPQKMVPGINGLGGKRLFGEPYFHTALRETLEELFDVTVNSGFLILLETAIKPSQVILNGTYVLLQFSFDDLKILLQYASTYCKWTPLYETMPLTINDLIFNRKYTSDSEISHLCLLPFIKGISIHNDLSSDIQGLKDTSV
jgi:hypothetical protein